MSVSWSHPDFASQRIAGIGAASPPPQRPVGLRSPRDPPLDSDIAVCNIPVVSPHTHPSTPPFGHAPDPSDPPAPDPRQAAIHRTERQLAMLDRIAELGMELAEALQRRAVAEALAQAGALERAPGDPAPPAPAEPAGRPLTTNPRRGLRPRHPGRAAHPGHADAPGDHHPGVARGQRRRCRRRRCVTPGPGGLEAPHPGQLRRPSREGARPRLAVCAAAPIPPYLR